jgi:hypothetical protein
MGKYTRESTKDKAVRTVWETPRCGADVYLSRFRVPGRTDADGAQGAGLGVLALERAKPNPASGRVTVHWQVPVEADVSLCVYNAAGQLVKTLANGTCRPGSYASVWNGTDTKGRRLANGVYFYALDNGTENEGENEGHFPYFLTSAGPVAKGKRGTLPIFLDFGGSGG